MLMPSVTHWIPWLSLVHKAVSPPAPSPCLFLLLLPPLSHNTHAEFQKSLFPKLNNATPQLINKNASFCYMLPDLAPVPPPTEPTEPDFGSDEFEEATVTFYDSSDCTNATESEVYTVAELYDLYDVGDGTSCSPSGDFDFYTLLHCSDSSPAAVYYEV